MAQERSLRETANGDAEGDVTDTKSAGASLTPLPPPTSAPSLSSPIPVAKPDDLEDVAWALSTAEAMWGRGDHAEAVKWLRRAAETAAEAEADDRALELAKAGADLATQVTAERPAAGGSEPPRAQVVAAQAVTAPPPEAWAGEVTRPGGEPTPALGSMRPAAAGLPGRLTPRVPLPSVIPRAAHGSQHPGAHSPAIPPTPVVPESPLSDSDLEPRTVARPQLHHLHTAAGVAPGPGLGGPDPRRTGASSADDAPPNTPRSGREGAAQPPPPPPRGSLPSVPARSESTRFRAAAPPVPMQTSQAVRVVVWRTADGVRVAPAGTTVAAISVEAVLVALDPAADLAAWLQKG